MFQSRSVEAARESLVIGQGRVPSPHVNSIQRTTPNNSASYSQVALAASKPVDSTRLSSSFPIFHRSRSSCMRKCTGPVRFRQHYKVFLTMADWRLAIL